MLENSDVEYLVVHCSDSHDSEDIGAREIHKMHRGFGWDGIGYHRVVRRNGSIEAGRPDCWPGAHVYGRNRTSLGICLIGRQHFTNAQMSALEQVLKEWQSRMPNALVCGHCDFDHTDKTCPNFDVHSWCEQVGLRSGMPAATVTDSPHAAQPGDPAGASSSDDPTTESIVDTRNLNCSNTALYRARDATASRETEVLYGEALDVLAVTGAWSRVRLQTDGYLGWIPSQHLGAALHTTHRVAVPRALVTSRSDIKSPLLGGLSMGARVRVLADPSPAEGHADTVAIQWPGGQGHVPAAHVVADKHIADDWVLSAEAFLGCPYLWGGRSSSGLDCSALVQLALQTTGHSAPRNSGDQWHELGRELTPRETPQRGDLAFWSGHVGILADTDSLLHANAACMQVAIEPFLACCERLAASGLPLLGIKRLALS